jgi:hypothetical protein
VRKPSRAKSKGCLVENLHKTSAFGPQAKGSERSEFGSTHKKSKMNIYLISQSDVKGYDTFDSAVVLAETPEKAGQIYPGLRWHTEPERAHIPWKHIETAWPQDAPNDWTNDPAKVSVEFIGHAPQAMEERVVCASFNAG